MLFRSSCGEKSRLAMIRLMLEPVNFLILDEPTNHLDMQSKEILKEALIKFTGTVIVVSHDREFLDDLVNCVYEFRNRKVKQHLGGIYEFLQRKKMESLKEIEVASKSRSVKNFRNKSDSVGRDISFEEQKEISRNIARSEKLVSSTEEKIESLEDKITQIDDKLSTDRKSVV